MYEEIYTKQMKKDVKSVKKQKKGEEVFTRGKVFILAFIEWINIFVYLLIYVLVIIEPFIK